MPRGRGRFFSAGRFWGRFGSQLGESTGSWWVQKVVKKWVAGSSVEVSNGPRGFGTGTSSNSCCSCWWTGRARGFDTSLIIAMMVVGRFARFDDGGLQ